ncbi:hypothetical protein [Sphingobacterium sp. LRF_L2]|uniref:hypothetical protein n=1 Tax=Sphingobacterium sp. LRF_L2 TaxID=3369421 RepID=UPI003F611C70
MSSYNPYDNDYQREYSAREDARAGRSYSGHSSDRIAQDAYWREKTAIDFNNNTSGFEYNPMDYTSSTPLSRYTIVRRIFIIGIVFSSFYLLIFLIGGEGPWGYPMLLVLLFSLGIRLVNRRERYTQGLEVERMEMQRKMFEEEMKLIKSMNSISTNMPLPPIPTSLPPIPTKNS